MSEISDVGDSDSDVIGCGDLKISVGIADRTFLFVFHSDACPYDRFTAFAIENNSFGYIQYLFDFLFLFFFFRAQDDLFLFDLAL